MSPRLVARVAWPLAAFTAVASVVTFMIEWSLLPDPDNDAIDQAGFLVALVAFVVLGAVIVRRHPRHPLGWNFLALGAVATVTGAGRAYAAVHAFTAADLPAAEWAGLIATAPFLWLFFLTFLPLLLFPDGLLKGRFWRWTVRLTVAAITVGTVVGATVPDVIREQDIPLDNPIGVPAIESLAEVFLLPGFLAVFAMMFVGIASVLVRYRRADAEQRHQIKWFAYAAGMIAIIFAASTWVPALGRDLVFGLQFALLAAAIGIAIFKYRLYEIDVVISKTLVFAGLAAFITSIYVGIVVGVGSLVGAGDEPNLALSIVATGVVAVAFQPVRERLTRLANRLVFGRRATPYEVLSTFSEHLGEVAAPEQTLERMARLLADGTGAARAQVWLRIGGELRPAATWPAHMTDDAEPDHRVEVIHEGELLGALSLDKQRGESLTPTDHKLVDDLAAQAGLVLRNLRLTEELKARIVDLQASRQRLVAAQDAERRRLERDLHDGAQRQLLELKSQLAAASSTAAQEQAEKAGQILEQVAADADDAVATLRELAHGIFPPLLAAEGLAGALRAQASKAAVPVVVEPDGIGRYSQDVEAAVYFCVLEAVQNAAKYANPTQVTVRLAQTDGHLTFEVRDDGDGFDPATTAKGAGTTNMTDRLDALGGRLEISSSVGSGTTVAGYLPVGVPLEVIP